MRTFNLLLVASLVGCASQPASGPRVAAATTTACVAPTSPPSSSSSSRAPDLGFDPPIASTTLPPGLSRSAREPAAANGVVQTSTSTFDVTTYIGDTTDDGTYDQQSTTERTGTERR